MLDTAVLYPVGLTDTLLRVAAAGMFHPLWSDEILAELLRNIQRDFPGADVEKRISDMNRAFPEANIDAYRELISGLTNDDKDRHVLAAAIAGEASLIVTSNLSDFQARDCEPHGVLAVHPDLFLLDRLREGPRTVLVALEQQAEAKRNPPLSLDQLLEHLGKSVPRFVGAVNKLR